MESRSHEKVLHSLNTLNCGSLFSRVQANVCKSFNHIAVACDPSLEMIVSADVNGPIRTFKTKENCTLPMTKLPTQSSSAGSAKVLDKGVSLLSQDSASTSPLRRSRFGSIAQLASNRLSSGMHPSLSQVSQRSRLNKALNLL